MLAALRESSLEVWQLALVLAAVGGLTVLLAARATGASAIRKLLALVSAVLAAGVAWGLIDLDLLIVMTKEDHFVEWLSASSLLAAAILTLVAVVRLYRQGQPSHPKAMLAAGLACAVFRELEYGGVFVGRQFLHTRDMFRLDAYMGPAYFERTRVKVEIPFSADTLYVFHLCFTVVVVAIVALLIWAAVRHRRAVLTELRDLHRTFPGRLCLLGVGVLLMAQAVGGAMHDAPFGGPGYSAELDPNGFWHRIFEETIECWGAVVLLLCAVAIWQTTRASGNQAGERDQ